MVNEPIDGSNKLRLLVQIKCWMTAKRAGIAETGIAQKMTFQRITGRSFLCPVSMVQYLLAAVLFRLPGNANALDQAAQLSAILPRFPSVTCWHADKRLQSRRLHHEPAPCLLHSLYLSEIYRFFFIPTCADWECLCRQAALDPVKQQSASIRKRVSFPAITKKRLFSRLFRFPFSLWAQSLPSSVPYAVSW